MNWAILYHTEGHFEELVELLEKHSFSPEVFCDPHCHELYIPNLNQGSVKCPQTFYIAVPRDEHLNANKIVHQWIDQNEKGYQQVKKSTFTNSIKAAFYTLVILFIYGIFRNFTYLEIDIITELTNVIICSALLWTVFFISLITRKPRGPKNQRDFT